jgi:hypothetical protein
MPPMHVLLADLDSPSDSERETSVRCMHKNFDVDPPPPPPDHHVTLRFTCKGETEAEAETAEDVTEDVSEDVSDDPTESSSRLWPS